MKEDQSRPGISSHFRREAKLMAAFLPAILLLGLLAAFLVPYLLHKPEQARCHAMGGSWQSGTCEQLSKPNVR